MSETLEYAVSVEGADTATQTLEAIKVKQLQLASEASRLAAQVSAAMKAAAAAEGQAAAEAGQKVDQLRAQLARVQVESSRAGQQFSRLQQQTQTAGIGMADMASRTSDAISRLAGLTHEAAEHIQQMQGLSQQTRDTAGAIDEMTQQLIRDTQAYGAFGLAVNTARAGLRELEYQFGATEQAAVSAERVTAFARRIRGDVDQRALQTRLIEGRGTDQEYGSAIQETADRLAAVTVMESRGDRAAGTSSTELGIQLDMMVRGQRMMREAAAQAEADLSNLAANLRDVREERSRGGGRASADPFSPEALRESLQRSMDLQKAAQREMAESRNAANLQLADRERAQLEATNAQKLESERQMYDAMQELRERDREYAEQRAHQERGIWEASAQGLAAVLSAATSTNRALLEMHQQTLDSGLVWANGMRGIGADVSSALGSELTNAFSSSLDAWLSGSKTFGEAALDMARSVTKSLTQQGIIKAITETAEGLGALALTWGVPNPASLLHFASAGTWAAIAGVSGIVGAGIGAFGGGAGSGAQGQQRGSQGQSRMQPANNQGGGTTVININVPPSLMTNAERGQFISQSFQAARRQGQRLAA